MTTITYQPIDKQTATQLRNGGLDANGQIPERQVSDGGGNPCRCCLCDVPKGAQMLVLAHRPFATINPYAETGPIFLCADDCSPWSGQGLPPIFLTSPDYLLKAYTPDERIKYGTGQITASADIAAYASDLLARDDIAFVDVRSARNNCYQARIVRS